MLAANVLAGGLPDKHGYTITFTICVAVGAFGILASLAVPGGRWQTAHVLTVADAVPAGD